MPRRTIPGLSVVVLLAAWTVATGCAAAIDPVQVEAARTAARVKTALVNDPLVGARPIDVRVNEGVVQLSGRVASADEANRAVELARSVPGVARVVTRLQVGAEPPVPAGQDEDVEPFPEPRGPALEFEELEDERTLLAVGGALRLSDQLGRASGPRLTLSPIARLGSGRGLGPTIAFDWYDVSPLALPGAGEDVGRVSIRPIMAGVRYSMPIGRFSMAPSVVGGYAFNSLEVAGAGRVERLSVGVDNSFVWRPGVSFWFESGRRLALHASVGRVMTKPRFTVVDQGRLVERRARADATVVLVGVAYKLF